MTRRDGLIIALLLAFIAGSILAVRQGQEPGGWPQRDSVSQVGTQVITSTDVEVQLRTNLWRQDANWQQMTPAQQKQMREAALQDLIDDRLVRHYREAAHGGGRGDVQEASRQETALWARQFQDPKESEQRMALQNLYQTDFVAGVLADQEDQAWLEHQVAAKVTVSEEQLRQWYEANQEQLRVPVRHRVAHIYLSRHEPGKPDREAEIRAIHQRLLNAEASFDDLAASHSEDERTKLRGGDLNWFSANRMPADFIAAVEGLAVGQTSLPVATALGWHIIRLSERKRSRLLRFEEVRDEIEARLLSKQREEAVQQFLVGLRKRAEEDGILWIQNGHRS